MKTTAPGVKASESKRSATTGTRDVLVRNLPEGFYQLLREVSFRTQADYAIVLSAALSAHSETLDDLVLDYVESRA